jgi:hypothetical protein
MLVDVVTLRERGVPLPREQVLAATPHRGHLSVARPAKGYPRKAYLMHREEQLFAKDRSCVLLPLTGVVLTKLAHDSFVLAGTETIEHYAERHEYAQAWWCRIVHDLAPSVPAEDTAHR